MKVSVLELGLCWSPADFVLLESSGIVMLKPCGPGLLGSKGYTIDRVMFWSPSGLCCFTLIHFWLCYCSAAPGQFYCFVLWLNFWHFQTFKMDCCGEVWFCCWVVMGVYSDQSDWSYFFMGFLQDFSFGFHGVGLGSKTACRIWLQSHCAFGAQWVCVIGLQFI